MKKLLVAVAFLVVGCATVPYQPYAREVKKKPREGGIIALKTEHRPEDRVRADYLMAQNCSTDHTVKVNEEGEVVTGAKTRTAQNKYNENREQGFRIGGMQFGTGQTRPEENTNSVSETEQVKEWQISYECVANAPAPRGKKSAVRN